MYLTEQQEEQLRKLELILHYADPTGLDQAIVDFGESRVIDVLTGKDAPRAESILSALRLAIEYNESKVIDMEQQVMRLEADMKCILKYLKAQEDNKHCDDLFQACNRHSIW